MATDYDQVSAFIKHGGKPTPAVIKAARRLANRQAVLAARLGARVELSPWMLALLRLDRNGNPTKQ